jgi:parvulin-like peptidyl-prolyl isomerase
MPQALEQLITREILVSEAKKLNQPFVGARDQVAREVQAYHTQDITVTDEEVRKYYAENPASFTIPASAEVKGISFKKEDEAKAKAFREAALRGGKLEELAKANGGTVTDYGKVNPGTLPPVANRLVFLTKGNFPKGPLGEVSEVVKLDDGSFQVLIVNNRVAEKLKPFEEVADQAREQVLAQKRNKAAQAWVAELRKQTKVENNLNKVLAELTPKQTKPASSNPDSGQQTPAQPKQENPTSPSKP